MNRIRNWLADRLIGLAIFIRPARLGGPGAADDARLGGPGAADDVRTKGRLGGPGAADD